MPEKWDWEIKPSTSWLGAELTELLSHKDLLMGMVRKDFLASYQQTILGPFWVLLYPLLSVFTYFLVFSKLIGLKTDGVPSFLFYLAGITLWNLFTELFTNISSSFSGNVGLFSKVYFPRLIIPLSNTVLSLMRFGIQLLLLFAVLLISHFKFDLPIHLGNIFLLFPAAFIITGIAFGAGLIFSMLTVKYRDLTGLMQLMIRLLMFICPIFYSLSIVPDKYKWFVNINPLSPMFELFRFAIFGKGIVTMPGVIYSVVFMLVCIAVGVGLFNKMNDKLIEIA